MRLADRSKPRVREGLPASLELSEAETVVSREMVPYITVFQPILTTFR